MDGNLMHARIFAALSEDGKITMKMQETFFAHRFAMFTDKFQVNRMIIHEKVRPSSSNSIHNQFNSSEL